MVKVLDPKEDSRISDGHADGQGSYKPKHLQDLEKNSSAPNSSDENAQKQEENTPKHTQSQADHSKAKAPLQERLNPKNLKHTLKKGGPIGIILLLLGFGGLGIGMLMGPAMGIINFREVISNALNDTSAVYNGRKAKVVKSKVTSSMGHCGPTVSVRCKFSSMSSRQLRAFERAGIAVECDGGCRRGATARNQVTSLSFPDGGTRGQRVTIDGNNLNNIDRIMRQNPNVQRALWNAYNPNFMSMATRAATNGMNRLGVTKQKLSGTSTDQLSSQLNDRTNNRSGSASSDGVRSTDADNGRSQSQVDSDNSRASQMQDQANTARGSGISRFARGASILGAGDDLCMVYNTSRALQVMNKTLRYARLAGFAMAVLATADSIKAGTATPEEVEYIGDKLNEPDLRQELSEEIPDNLDLGESAEERTLSNPEYGQTATDSPIYRAAAYNDPVNPEAMSTANSNFMAGGFGMGALGIISVITGEMLQNPRVTCGIIQNPLVRGGSILLGTIASATGIGLVITGLSAYAQYRGVNAAITAMEDQVQQEVEDIDIDAEARHGQFTAATYTGTSAIHGEAARGSGAMPVTEETFDDFAMMQNSYQQDFIAMETLNAKENPFDIYNQFSFAGQATRQLASITQNTQSSAVKLTSIISGSLASIVNPNVHANSTVNPQHYEVCDDADYEELGIKADFMCNVRHALTSEEMDMETNDVVEYMITNGHIDNNAADGADIEQVADSDLYSDFLRWCVNRQEAFGTQGAEQDLLGRGGEDAWTTGEECIGRGNNLTSQQLSNFKVFTTDYTIMQSMDYEAGLADGGGGYTTAGAVMGDTPTTSDGWSYPAPSTNQACGFDCYANHRGMDIQDMGLGDDIHAVREGVVTHAGASPHNSRERCLSLGLGDIWRGPNYTVVIRHDVNGDRYESSYSHLQADSIAVSTGERVSGGQVVGKVGMTGCTTGPHAHIDIARPDLSNYYSNTIDPTTIFGRSW